MACQTKRTCEFIGLRLTKDANLAQVKKGKGNCLKEVK